MNGILGKIAGWAQFGLQVLAQVGTTGTPHGWAGWVTLIGSLAAAIGIHAASNVGQVSTASKPSAVPLNSATHVTQ